MDAISTMPAPKNSGHTMLSKTDGGMLNADHTWCKWGQLVRNWSNLEVIGCTVIQRGWTRVGKGAKGMFTESFRGFRTTVEQPAGDFRIWSNWCSSQIERNADSATISPAMLARQSTWWHNFLSPARLGSILLFYFNRIEIDTMWSSEYTEWPTTQGGPLPDLVQYT